MDMIDKSIVVRSGANNRSGFREQISLRRFELHLAVPARKRKRHASAYQARSDLVSDPTDRNIGCIPLPDSVLQLFVACLLALVDALQQRELLGRESRAAIPALDGTRGIEKD